MRRAQLFSNASFWVGANEDEWASQVLCVDGVITAVGPEHAQISIETLADSERLSIETVDLNGAFVYPAFRDGHCHPLFAGRELLGCNLTGTTSIAEIQQALRDFMREQPELMWVDAASYDRGLLSAVDNPRLLLDEVSNEKAIVLHADDHHTLWVNTKALEFAGLIDEIPLLAEGEVSVNQQGQASGLLREWPAMRLVMDLMPQPTTESDRAAWNLAEQKLLELGVVEVQDAWIDPGMTTSYIELVKSDSLHMTVKLAFRLDASSWRQDCSGFMDDLKAVRELAHPRLQANAVKIFIDGAFGNQTAAVKTPYTSGGFGQLNWSEAELLQAMRLADGEGLQLHFHAIGDAAVSAAVSAIEKVSPKLRPVIAHAELIDEADIERLGKVDAVLQFQPLWARRDSMLASCSDALGEDRLERLYAISTCLRAGIRVAFGSDWPVSSPNPLAGIAVAATRLNADDLSQPALNSEQAVTVAAAWRAYSASVAEQLGGEPRGLIATGHRADLLVLPINVFEATPLSLSDLKVDSVYIGGDRV